MKTGRMNENRWCCLIIFLTVWAVRIEIVPKLHADSFLKAIIQFKNRRGKPAAMTSDSRTIFIGADQEFKEYITAWNKENNEKNLVPKGTTWTFNQTAAPHFEELWKRLVRSCMKAMYDVLVFNYGSCSIDHNVPFRANIECQTTDTSKLWINPFGLRCWRWVFTACVGECQYLNWDG